MYIHIHIYCYEFAGSDSHARPLQPKRSRASAETRNSVVASGQLRKPATDALTHHKLVNILSTQYRVNRRISIYLIIRADRSTENLYLDELVRKRAAKRARSVCDAKRF